MEEVWKEISNYEGYYEVSNFGNIKSCNRIIICGGKKHHKKERILKQGIDRYGYLNVILHKNNIAKIFQVHRLVAKEFINNVDNKAQVNHKDGVRSNNRVENLEWVTCSENHFHAYRELNRKKISNMGGRYGRNHPKAKAVIQYDINNNIIKEFLSIIEASLETNIRKNNISQCCTGKKKSAGGFKWKHKF